MAGFAGLITCIVLGVVFPPLGIFMLIIFGIPLLVMGATASAGGLYNAGNMDVQDFFDGKFWDIFFGIVIVLPIVGIMIGSINWNEGWQDKLEIDINKNNVIYRTDSGIEFGLGSLVNCTSRNHGLLTVIEVNKITIKGIDRFNDDYYCKIKNIKGAWYEAIKKEIK